MSPRPASSTLLPYATLFRSPRTRPELTRYRETSHYADVRKFLDSLRPERPQGVEKLSDVRVMRGFAISCQLGASAGRSEEGRVGKERRARRSRAHSKTRTDGRRGRWKAP